MKPNDAHTFHTISSLCPFALALSRTEDDPLNCFYVEGGYNRLHYLLIEDHWLLPDIAWYLSSYSQYSYKSACAIIVTAREKYNYSLLKLNYLLRSENMAISQLQSYVHDRKRTAKCVQQETRK